MNAHRYVNEVVEPSNARAHIARRSEDNVNLLQQPPRSPNLSLIKHI